MSKRQAKVADPLSYTAKERNSYLIGMAGQNVIYGVVSSGLAFYFSQVIALPALAISIIMMIARIWDAINDPIMGTFVDKTRSKWGKCRPYLMFMPVIIMVGTMLCFANGIYSEIDNTPLENGLIIAWAGISYIMWGMMYTAGDIPIWGIASRMTADEKKRANLLSLARMVAGIGGALGFVMVPIAQALAPMLNVGTTAKNLQMAFIIVAIVLTIVGTIMFQFASLAKERVEGLDELTGEKRGIIDNFKIMWQNKPFRRILISGVIRSPFQLLLILAMPLITLYFGNNGATTDFVTVILLQYGPIAVGVFGGQFGAMALTPLLCKKFEKKTIFNVMNIVSGVAFALIFVLYLIFPHTLGGLPIILLAIAFLIASAGVGFIMVLQSMMIADCVDYEEKENNRRPDGVFFSGQSFVTKLSAGLAVLLQGVVYAVVAYEGDTVIQVNDFLAKGIITFNGEMCGSYAMAMFFLVSIPPAIGMILSVIPMFKYELTDKEHSKILDELNARRIENGMILQDGAEGFMVNEVNNDNQEVVSNENDAKENDCQCTECVSESSEEKEATELSEENKQE